MATTSKMPSGTWISTASKTINGKRIRKSFTAPTKREAEGKASAWLLSEDDTIKKSKVTLKSVMETYIESCRCSGMSPSTIKGYTTAMKNGFKNLLESNVFDITTQDVQREVNDLASRLSAKTIRNYVGFLGVSTSQLDDLKFNTARLKTPKSQRKEMEIPSTEQVQELLRFSAHDSDLYLCILLASTMGLRLSEICALTWSKVTDIGGEKYLKIDSALVPDESNVYHLKGAKTEAGNRTLPIPHSVYREMVAHRSSGDSLIKCKPSAITTKYAKLTDKLNVPGRFHDLRHYHASVMISVGAPEKYICADMGHASFDMVRRVYGHVMADKQQEINEKMRLATESLIK